MEVKCARIVELQKRQKERMGARGGKNFLRQWTAN